MERCETIAFTLNGAATEVDAPGDLPMLHVLREILGLKGTRFGCGQASCGACTIVVDGRAVTSCDWPLSAASGCRIETIEGLAGDPAHPLIDAALELQAAQCGYCLPGILMAAKALLDHDPAPDRAAIAAALDGNLCRCGTHVRILRAIELAAARLSGRPA